MPGRRARGCALLLVLAGCAAPPPAAPVIASIPHRLAPEFNVTRVVDGDTVALTDARTGLASNVRLTGYDTPETFRPNCAAERALGQRATAYLEARLSRAERVHVRFDGTDKFRRPLVALTLDGAPLERIMVRAGVAVPYDGGRRINWCDRLRAS